MGFIVFEGLDASGKSTLISRVHHHLSQLNLNVELLRDPGSTEVGNKIRNIILDADSEAPVPRAELLLYQAARVQMVETKAVPAIKAGSWILCDRFYSSTIAFQVFARNLDRKMVDLLNDFVTTESHPDLFVFLDISVEESNRRKSQRTAETGVEQDRMEKENNDFQKKVRQGYLAQAKEKPDSWLVLDGTLTPDQLCDQVIKEFKKRKWLN